MGLLQTHNRLFKQSLDSKTEARSAKTHFEEEVAEFIDAEKLEDIVLEAGDVIYTLLRFANEKAKACKIRDEITLEHIIRHNVNKLSVPRK